MMKKTSLKSSRSSVQDIRSSSKYTHGFNKQRTMYDGVVKHGNAEIITDVFTFRELAAATQNFHPEMLVGEGGFGRVYKGQLKQQNQIVAVKQLYQNGVQGNREFLDSVVALSHIQHPNLVNLIGYCADGRQKILVYEYMSNGSLENHLFDVSAERAPLDWYTRMKIAKGTAQGLEYLHDTANPPIVYHDFKASNILLDDEFNTKLSDFGLTKLGPDGENDRVSMMVTYGYCAPEYAQTGEPTSKSNVYSFGVVLLEILSGRRAIDTTRPTEEQNLVTWAQPIFKDRKNFRLMADPLLEDKYPVKGLYQAIAIAAMCLQEESSTRPLIADVATTLEYLLNENFENNDIINSPDDELDGELGIGDDATS